MLWHGGLFVILIGLFTWMLVHSERISTKVLFILALAVLLFVLYFLSKGAYASIKILRKHKLPAFTLNRDGISSVQLFEWNIPWSEVAYLSPLTAKVWRQGWSPKKWYYISVHLKDPERTKQYLDGLVKSNPAARKGRDLLNQSKRGLFYPVANFGSPITIGPKTYFKFKVRDVLAYCHDNYGVELGEQEVTGNLRYSKSNEDASL